MSIPRPSGRSARPAPPARLRIFVGLVSTVSLLVWAVSAVADGDTATTHWLVAVLLTGMVGVAHVFPVHMAPRNKVSVDTAPAFAAALLLPLPLAIGVSILGIGGGETARRTALIQRVYNTAAAGLRAAAAAAVYVVLAEDGPEPTFGRSGQDALAAITAALAMYLVNSWLFEGVVAVQQRRNPLPGWLSRRRRSAVFEASQYVFGALIAAVGARWPAGLVLLAPPSFVVYRALRDGVAIRVQAQEGLEELADVIDARDQFAAGHSRRTAELARQLALRLGLPGPEVERIATAARVHDIGAIGLPSSILNKPGPLTRGEWREVQAHPDVGARLLTRFPRLSEAAEMVRAHHERWDGGGYPRGLRGEAISTGARILALADAVDAMQSERPHRRALPPDLVRAELVAARGTQFDPAMVDVMLTLIDRDVRQAAPRGRR